MHACVHGPPWPQVSWKTLASCVMVGLQRKDDAAARSRTLKTSAPLVFENNFPSQVNRVYVSRDVQFHPDGGSIRFRLAPRAYAPWGCIVRVVSQTKSRKIPTRNIIPLFFASRCYNEQRQLLTLSDDCMLRTWDPRSTGS